MVALLAAFVERVLYADVGLDISLGGFPTNMTRDVERVRNLDLETQVSDVSTCFSKFSAPALSDPIEPLQSNRRRMRMALDPPTVQSRTGRLLGRDLVTTSQYRASLAYLGRSTLPDGTVHRILQYIREPRAKISVEDGQHGAKMATAT